MDGVLPAESMTVLTSFEADLLTYSEGSPVVEAAVEAEAVAGAALSSNLEAVRAIGLCRLKPAAKAAK